MPKQKAFTLLELLVVISVIALLLAVFLPGLRLARDLAREVVCRSNIRQWGAILIMYTNDHGDSLPDQKGHTWAVPHHWMYSLRNYTAGTEDIRLCPMASRPMEPKNARDVKDLWSPGVNIAGDTFLAWGRLKFRLQGRWTPDYYGSYGINSWLSTPQIKSDDKYIIGGDSLSFANYFWGSADVYGVDNIPVFLDGWWWCAWVKDTDIPPEYPGQKTNYPCGCKNSIHRFCIDRHRGFVNAGFLDGSAGKAALKELWTLNWHRWFNTTGPWTRAGGVLPEDWPEWMRGLRDY